jgi:hypothetical protein
LDRPEDPNFPTLTAAAHDSAVGEFRAMVALLQTEFELTGATQASRTLPLGLGSQREWNPHPLGSGLQHPLTSLSAAHETSVRPCG